MQTITKFLKEPLLHFLVIGASFYLINGLYGKAEMSEDDRRIVISAGEVEWLQDSWKKRWSRPPTVEELDGIVQAYLRELVLSREAVAMGLDKDDTVIRRRLAQKLEFLSQDLVEFTDPSDEELAAYMNENIIDYEAPAVATMTQIFYDPDKRDDQALVEAERQKEILNAREFDPDYVNGLGDTFFLQKYYPERSQSEIARLFGGGFAESVADLPVGTWSGPILSGYGVHLVYIHDRRAAVPPTLDEAREKVLQDWKDEKRKELSDSYITNLLAQYDVKVEKLASQEPNPNATERAQ
jgi:hypothetical protein